MRLPAVAGPAFSGFADRSSPSGTAAQPCACLTPSLRPDGLRCALRLRVSRGKRLTRWTRAGLARNSQTAGQWSAQASGSAHAFGRATECPSAQADGQPYRAGSYRTSCPVPRTGHRDMRLWWRSWSANTLNTAFEDGGSPRSGPSSRRCSSARSKGARGEGRRFLYTMLHFSW